MISRYRTGRPHDLAALSQSALVANGDDDVMVATSYSQDRADRVPNATLRIYPDSGHDGVFQYHEQLVYDAAALLST